MIKSKFIQINNDNFKFYTSEIDGITYQFIDKNVIDNCKSIDGYIAETIDNKSKLYFNIYDCVKYENNNKKLNAINELVNNDFIRNINENKTLAERILNSQDKLKEIFDMDKE